MNYGVQLSASGVLTSLYRQDVLSNNLANMDSVGYKPDVIAVRQRDPARVEDGLSFMPSNKLLEKLGAGVMMSSNAVDYEQGALQMTDQPLDLAVRGNGFFVVRDESDNGKDKLRLTRDGRFGLDKTGRLVMSSTGMPVLDAAGRVFQLLPGVPVKVEGDGTLVQNGEEMGQIHLVDPVDKSHMVKAGYSLFRAPAEAMSTKGRASGDIRQGALERSGVNEITTIMAITSASRDVDANMSLISQQDRLNERVINVLGRVA